jgi:GNAT superfamily N-acetyltransferase
MNRSQSQSADSASYSANEKLRDGRSLRIRAIRAEDKDALVAMFKRLSPKTVYYRFHGAKRRLTKRELVYLTELDFHRQAAVVAILEVDGEERISGVGRYASAPDTPDDRAEVALTVEDVEQGCGIGTLLLTHLMRIARAEGIVRFDAFVLADNTRMIELFERTGLVTERSAGAGACHLVLTLHQHRSPRT